MCNLLSSFFIEIFPLKIQHLYCLDPLRRDTEWDIVVKMDVCTRIIRPPRVQK